ncbi:MAG: hypothetical protein KF830_09535 [Planctomycetes bacterium]|nr:hypothetical protein [Planctomycetota bacterium]
MNQPNLASLFLLALLATGCSSGPPYEALPIEDDAEQSSYVVVTDAKLRDLVRVGRPFVERVAATNQLRVAVPIRSIHDETIQILAQVSFLNASKQPIGDETNRQVKVLPPGSTVTHIAISKSAEAADWVMRLSWNR